MLKNVKFPDRCRHFPLKTGQSGRFSEHSRTWKIGRVEVLHIKWYQFPQLISLSSLMRMYHLSKERIQAERERERGQFMQICLLNRAAPYKKRMKVAVLELLPKKKRFEMQLECLHGKTLKNAHNFDSKSRLTALPTDELRNDWNFTIVPIRSFLNPHYRTNLLVQKPL